MGFGSLSVSFDTFLSVLFLNIVLGLSCFSPGHRRCSAQGPSYHLLAVAYFAITEGVWGASLGKALCGFRVVTEAEHRRGSGEHSFERWSSSCPRGLHPAWSSRSPVSCILQRQAAQSLSRRRSGGRRVRCFLRQRAGSNGFAGIHEWVSHTRTVLKAAVERAGVLSVPSPIEVPATHDGLDPYRLVDTSRAQPNCGAALGYDERLRRTVWLRFPGVDADPVPLVRRTLRRPARPRWLAGQRTRGLAWDAYEQVPGQPFDTLLTRAQSWQTVRGWLCDLAEEVHAGSVTARFPTSSSIAYGLGTMVERGCWIGRRRTVALICSSPPPKQAIDLPQAERFLYRVAVSALEGHVLADTHPDVRTLQVPLPMVATDCLAKLRGQRFTTSEDMLTAVTSAARGPAAISRTKRAAHFSLCAIPTMVMLLIGLLTVYHVRPRLETARAHVGSVRAGEAADRAGIEVGDVIVAVDGEPIVFASQLRDAVVAHPDQPITLSILRDGQPLMIRATPTRRATGVNSGSPSQPRRPR